MESIYILPKSERQPEHPPEHPPEPPLLVELEAPPTLHKVAQSLIQPVIETVTRFTLPQPFAIEAPPPSGLHKVAQSLIQPISAVYTQCRDRVDSLQQDTLNLLALPSAVLIPAFVFLANAMNLHVPGLQLKEPIDTLVEMCRHPRNFFDPSRIIRILEKRKIRHSTFRNDGTRVFVLERGRGDRLIIQTDSDGNVTYIEFFPASQHKAYERQIDRLGVY